MSTRYIVLLVIVFLLVIGIIMYFYFRSQQVKAKLQMQQAQIAAITGIETTGSSLFDFINSALGGGVLELLKDNK